LLEEYDELTFPEIDGFFCEEKSFLAVDDCL